MILKFSHYNLFFFILLLTIAIILTYRFIYSDDDNFNHTTTSFPNRYPLVNRDPIFGPRGGRRCINQVEKDGQMINEIELLGCSTDKDCAICDDVTKVTCQAVSSQVAQQQSKQYNNTSPNNKFCMPQLTECVPDGSISTHGECKPNNKLFKQCVTDNDCNFCDTKNIPKGERFKCETVSQGKPIKYKINDNCYQYLNTDKDTRICLPQRAYCENGTAVWTDKNGMQEWTCECDYQGKIFDGESCQYMVACNNDMVIGNTKEKQQLLINNSPNSSLIGQPWINNKKVDPLGSTCKKNPNKTCTNNFDCGAQGPCIPNTICRCDGIHIGKDNFIYKNDPQDNLKCIKDTCFSNPLAGRYNTTLAKCVCSGPGRALWEWDKTKNLYDWKGYCQDQKLGNMIIKGNPSQCVDGNKKYCKKSQQLCTTDKDCGGNGPCIPIKPNMYPSRTRLVPTVMKNPIGKKINVCARDPCGGRLDIGHWDPLQNECVCSRPYVDVSTNITEVNPIGHMCFDACFQNTSCDVGGGTCKNINDHKGSWKCVGCQRGASKDGHSCRDCIPNKSSETCSHNSQCCSGKCCTASRNYRVRMCQAKGGKGWLC